MTQVHAPSASSVQTAGQVQFGMAEGTSVLTLEGALPIEYLATGDRVVTRAGARRITAIEVTVLQNARVVRVAENVLGAGRPEAEVLLAPNQTVLIRDWRAKALYGAAQAMVPAARLVDGDYIRMDTVAELRLYTLRLDGEAVIYAGGLELGCPAETVEA